MDRVERWIRNELFHQVPICISVIDRNFCIIHANRMFTETYGPWENQFCYTVYKGRSERCEECVAADTFRDGRIRTHEERGRVCGGLPHYYFVHVVPLLFSGTEIPYVIEMSTDITEVKRLEQEKLEAERLAAVGQTVAGLAHGIKNIIMGLEGGIYVMGSGIRREDTHRIKQGWSMLEENIARISEFVKEFLSFARGAVPKVAMIDPGRVAQKVIDLFNDKARMVGVDLRGDIQTPMIPAPMDEDEIHTCLVNLVSNALDACEVSEKADRHVTLRASERDNVIIFEVSDNGRGMDYEVKQKVFTNYFSTKGSGKGTGLGLLTTRKIVQQHGGHVSFQSEVGAGSVFRLEFPRKRLPAISKSGQDFRVQENQQVLR
ncbi:MAG: PAS domain-containing sensor histidine kinase [bacterium]|nr:PAS domain-containing sensor histidine kinase [bacterium]